jgi:hypothetical protein
MDAQQLLDFLESFKRGVPYQRLRQKADEMARTHVASLLSPCRTNEDVMGQEWEKGFICGMQVDLVNELIAELKLKREPDGGKE